MLISFGNKTLKCGVLFISKLRHNVITSMESDLFTSGIDDNQHSGAKRGKTKERKKVLYAAAVAVVLSSCSKTSHS